MGGIASSALTWRLCCTHWRILALYRCGLDLLSLPLDALIFKAVLGWSISKMSFNGTGIILTITMRLPSWPDILISEIRQRDIAHSRRDKRWTTNTVPYETNRTTSRKIQPRSLLSSRDTASSVMAIGDGEGLLAADVAQCQATLLVGEEAIYILYNMYSHD